VPWIATAQYEFAHLLANRGAEGDAERAHRLLDECIVTCSARGFTALESRARTVAAGIS
jgi:hypothetical protein